MKMYAVMTSERDSRPVRKGGDRHIVVELNNNIRVVTEFNPDTGVTTTYWQKRKPFAIGEWTPQVVIEREFENVAKG